MVYIYDRADWPAFHWDSDNSAVELAALRFKQGAFLARMDTALRDIEDLIGRGLMVRAEAGGRSTSYRLAG